MSVNPGFGGQSFIDIALRKIEEARKRIERTGRDIRLEVDGGIKIENIARAASAGADTFVAGSAIFNAKDYKVRDRRHARAVGRRRSRLDLLVVDPVGHRRAVGVDQAALDVLQRLPADLRAPCRRPLCWLSDDWSCSCGRRGLASPSWAVWVLPLVGGLAGWPWIAPLFIALLSHRGPAIRPVGPADAPL